jgi:hypothetical protein
MYLVAFALVQRVQHRLVNVSKSQFGVRVGKQFANKATANIAGSEV